MPDRFGGENQLGKCGEIRPGARIALKRERRRPKFYQDSRIGQELRLRKSIFLPKKNWSCNENLIEIMLYNLLEWLFFR